MAATLRGKTVLLTGASRGLGAELARWLHKESANLILVARKHKDDDSLEQIEQELVAQNRMKQWVRTVQADLGSATGADKIMRGVNDVDVLINNAAVLGPVGNLEDCDLMEWTDCLRVNLLAPVALCKAVIPHMKAKNHGKIINIAGGGATGPRPKYTAYAAAKTALVRFSETLAQEVAQYNVDVNCVSPGQLPTRLTNFQGEREAFGKAVRLIGFLATKYSDGITGRLVSAQYDNWALDFAHWDEAKLTDIYTLRRVIDGKGGTHRA